MRPAPQPREPAPPAPVEDSRITVVVASRNRREELLSSLARHRAPVILLDNASTDGTAEAVRQAYPHVRVVALDRNQGATARTLGAHLAATPYVAFADDDSWWAPGALQRAVAAFEQHPRLGLLAGRILVGPEEFEDPICAELAASPLPQADDLPGPALLGFVACGAVVRRQAFLDVGGFDDVVVFPGEEERVAWDLAAAGWGLSYVDAVVAHHHPSRLRDPSPRRQAQLVRSALLTAAMRRPWPVVRDHLAAGLAAGGVGRSGVVSALPRMARALGRRRPLPPPVEEGLARLAERRHQVEGASRV